MKESPATQPNTPPLPRRTLYTIYKYVLIFTGGRVLNLRLCRWTHSGVNISGGNECFGLFFLYGWRGGGQENEEREWEQKIVKQENILLFILRGGRFMIVDPLCIGHSYIPAPTSPSSFYQLTRTQTHMLFFAITRLFSITVRQCCGSASSWCGSCFSLWCRCGSRSGSWPSLWCGAGSGSYHSLFSRFGPCSALKCMAL